MRKNMIEHQAEKIEYNFTCLCIELENDVVLNALGFVDAHKARPTR